MHWIPAFYERQNELYGTYSGPVLPHHHDHARAVTARLGGPKRLLELGAGGGQNACALAELGHDVTAVELVPGAAAHAAGLARQVRNGALHVVQGDFYKVALEGTFDAVGYWDGFGVGSDDDQRRLLRRVAAWLRPQQGATLLDVYTPWYWAAVSGTRQHGPSFAREYGFDAEGCRMLDTWWAPKAPEARVTQSLRCYSPADLMLLLHGTGLRLVEIEPGGAYDEAANVYTPKVPLADAMMYTAVLKHES